MNLFPDPQSSPQYVCEPIGLKGIQGLDADLVFVQNREGHYLNFHWQQGQVFGVISKQIIGQSFNQSFTPDNPEAYIRRLQRVLSSRIPEHCHCSFRYRDRTFPFELVISPILPATGAAQSVLVMGHLLERIDNSRADSSPLPSQPALDKTLLTQIAREIRSSLNPDTIWQQTADIIGSALQVSRCLMIATDVQKQYLEVRGEYYQEGQAPMLGQRWASDAEPFWQQVLEQAVLLSIDTSTSEMFPARSTLIVPTVCQHQCNGLICLQQCDRPRTWSQEETELVQEIADQMGTAIAHATLYQGLEEVSRAAEEASRMKSEFLTSTTHELRTPLNGIIGFLRLILDGMADDAQEQRQFLEEAHNSALHLLNLINDILDIAKIEAGRMELEMSAVPLEELFHSVDSFARPQAQGKNLDFTIQCPPTLTPIIVYGNYQRLLQVMLNLVGNAIKFTHQGSIRIGAELRKKQVIIRDRAFPGMVKVSIADTGIGVSLDKQFKLFEKFVQIDASRTKPYGGTGLGLAISQKLVEAMGGKVKFYSMGEGLGSTVTFTIPLERMPVIETKTAPDRLLDKSETPFNAIDF
jgi:signal transduction histidine kinase